MKICANYVWKAMNWWITENVTKKFRNILEYFHRCFLLNLQKLNDKGFKNLHKNCIKTAKMSRVTLIFIRNYFLNAGFLITLDICLNLYDELSLWMKYNVNVSLCIVVTHKRFKNLCMVSHVRFSVLSVSLKGEDGKSSYGQGWRWKLRVLKQPLITSPAFLSFIAPGNSTARE